MGEVVHKIINQAHVIVGIARRKLYPLVGENLVVGEVDTEVKSKADRQSYQYAANIFWREPTRIQFPGS